MKYDLVFEGSGAKGMVHVGAYEEFVRRGHTPGRLLGTSARHIGRGNHGVFLGFPGRTQIARMRQMGELLPLSLID